MRIDLKSMSLGVACAAAVGFAATKQRLDNRFLVLEATKTGGHLALKLCPHYGKISDRSLKFRQAKETQEITLLVSPDHDLQRGDIIAFDGLERIRPSPGSQVIRRLPDGGQELVPFIAALRQHC